MNIRNFCIIAHIDHGKSTLADRMLEITWTLRKVEHGQVLDRMDLEQERWITIKLTPVRMQRKWYEFNLIDTPGHVDFQYEVSRSLAAVEGAILLVDASQWIQAQTLSVLYQAVEQWLEIIPVLNKIDLPAADPERVAKEIEHIIWIHRDDIICVSGKTWENVDKVLDYIIEKVPEPKIKKEAQINTALIFDCVYDSYKWVVAYIKVVEWQFKTGDVVYLVHSKNKLTITEVGHFDPEYSSDKVIKEWQIGYIVTWEKTVRNVEIWDTILGGIKYTQGDELKKYAVPGFRKIKPYVYAGVYPIDTNDYNKLKESLDKLSINDSAVEYEMEDSKALGFWFRCGFLGMLHMDIIKERLSREYNVETIFTIPTVVYLIKTKNLSLDQIKSGQNIQNLLKSWLYKQILNNLQSAICNLQSDDLENDIDTEWNQALKDILKPWLVVKSWADMVEQGVIDEIWEPIANVEIVGPEGYAGNIMQLCQEYRWKLVKMDSIDATRLVRHYELPMGEIIIDFYDRLKSLTKWYATMNYEFRGYQEADLIKLDIWINGEKIEALSRVVHQDKAYTLWRTVVEKLKDLIPKHLFIIPIQAGIGAKIIARETISAMRKDVIAKCYGWDVTRKRKLLKKQKEGKKRMKSIGSVDVPSDVFIKMVARN